MSETGIVINIFNTVDRIVEQFVFSGYSALSASMLNIFSIIFSITIASFGFAMITGRVSSPANEFVNNCIKVSLVFALLSNWGFFSSTVYSLLLSIPAEVVSSLSKAIQTKSSIFSGSLEGSIQSFFNTGCDFSKKMLSQTSWTTITPAIMALMVMVLTLVVCCYATFLMILSKIGLSFCLVTAPIFMTMGLFSAGKGIADNWVAHMIGFALMPIAVYCVLFFILTINDISFDSIEKFDGSTFNVIMTYLFTCLLSVPLLSQSQSLMQSISRGFSLSSMGAIGAGITQASKTKAGLSSAKSAYLSSKNWIGQKSVQMGGFANKMRSPGRIVGEN